MDNVHQLLVVDVACALEQNIQIAVGGAALYVNKTRRQMVVGAA